jgi:hypothetical protein
MKLMERKTNAIGNEKVNSTLVPPSAGSSAESQSATCPHTKMKQGRLTMNDMTQTSMLQ